MPGGLDGVVLVLVLVLVVEVLEGVVRVVLVVEVRVVVVEVRVVVVDERVDVDDERIVVEGGGGPPGMHLQCMYQHPVALTTTGSLTDLRVPVVGVRACISRNTSLLATVIHATTSAYIISLVIHNLRMMMRVAYWPHAATSAATPVAKTAAKSASPGEDILTILRA